MDNQCSELVPETVAVAADRSLEAAIAKVLEARDTADFTLAGYRVTAQAGVATVDLRLPAGAKRRFSSLSSCEQLALFGSIRKTLTSNPRWKIQSVQFTEKGTAIVL